jgi:hypothetical protein
LNTIETQKSAFFSQQVAYVQLKFGQNQGLWSQNGDTMSLGLGGVLQPLKKVHLHALCHSSTASVCAILARHFSASSGLFEAS